MSRKWMLYMMVKYLLKLKMHGRCTTYWDLLLVGIGGSEPFCVIGCVESIVNTTSKTWPLFMFPQERVRKMLASCPYES